MYERVFRRPRTGYADKLESDRAPRHGDRISTRRAHTHTARKREQTGGMLSHNHVLTASPLTRMCHVLHEHMCTACEVRAHSCRLPRLPWPRRARGRRPSSSPPARRAAAAASASRWRASPPPADGASQARDGRGFFEQRQPPAAPRAALRRSRRGGRRPPGRWRGPPAPRAGASAGARASPASAARSLARWATPRTPSRSRAPCRPSARSRRARRASQRARAGRRAGPSRRRGRSGQASTGRSGCRPRGCGP
mmetsp:Transcript_38693/g.127770  ORF Transcript_38693/g.127770 Transcript_38693/m.127770 type:complete len:253 (-) Transcript_38693:1030-1788(-)